MALVILKDVAKVFSKNGRAYAALAGLSMEIGRGEFVCLVGPSGCGKTTALNIIAGLVPPTEGSVEYDSRLVRGPNTRVSYMTQRDTLLPWRTVLGNVRLPLEVASRARGKGVPGPEQMLDLVGLTEFRKYYPHQLSGGMQQRVAIARSLVFNPSLLLMDEPFGALDEITRQAMRYELLRLWEAHGRRTVLFVTHSVAEAVALSDRVVVLSGRPGAVRADIDIELERPRSEEIEQSSAFRDYTDHLRGLLKEAANGTR